MFEPMTGLPDGVIGFEAVGEVEASGLRGRPDAGAGAWRRKRWSAPGPRPGRPLQGLLARRDEGGRGPRLSRQCLEADGGRQRPRVGRPPGDGVRLDGAQASSSGSDSPSGTPRSPGSPSASERDRGRAGAPGGGPLPPPARPSGSRGWSSTSARSRRSVGSTSRSAPGRSSGMSGPTVPARARPSGACSTSSGRRAGRSRSSGRIHGTPAWTCEAESATSRASCGFPSG